MEKLNIPYPVIVEGRYDRARLELVMRGQIILTDGFGVFRDEEKKALLRALAQKTPLIVLTDSDCAGSVIRSHLRGILPAERIIPLYIPPIKGKEKRKATPSAQGLLGVEGMETSLLRELLAPYEDASRVERAAENPLSKTDLYIDGLTGARDSAARRDALAQRLSLPTGMTPNALLAALRLLCSYEEYLRLVGREPPHTTDAPGNNAAV
jgi:ribonuclease M5